MPGEFQPFGFFNVDPKGNVTVFNLSLVRRITEGPTVDSHPTTFLWFSETDKVQVKATMQQIRHQFSVPGINPLPVPGVTTSAADLGKAF
ncbi:hypothetical protein SAMN02745857_02809 [Andreprevotia lacus DSM 23236]|jgi:hypothetical protein|uniref:Uncharacterized protein n=1 Tax=Andreprevotia lacus DSM 23236 TaxID=1121001 RepID=A0A1W1XTX5_9NEIS|nr:hypothetical protein [Andreprevotia lacus]SMC27312.1 hypothetical protein SAMN02745857_02809 [Andreprevotia lacus DSM 23236]